MLERASASSRVILPPRTSVASAASIDCIPCAAEVWSTEWIWCVLPSRIRFRTAGVSDEHLAARDPARAVGGRQQLLGHDALERDRQLHAHLLLLVRREDVDDPVDRLRRVLGVKGREDEVAGLGGGQRRRDRLEVAHLADEDHVGVLTERGLEAEREALRVVPDLALVDDAALVPVQELDRVLDREDVLLAAAVDLVDHRRERGRLARAGRPGHEHEAARLLDELVDDRRQAELLDRLDLGRDQTECGADRGALHVGVDPEAAVRRHRVREVDLPLLLERLRWSFERIA